LTLHHFQDYLLIQQNPCTRLGRFAGTHMAEGTVVVFNALHEDFDLSARFLFTEQTGRNHPGIIKDQQILRVEKLQNILKMLMPDGTGYRVDTKQTTPGSLWCRIPGNQLIGKIKIEV